MNHYQLHESLVFIQRRWWCIYSGIERGFSIMISFWKSKINSNKLCSQLGQVKVALEKHQELVNRKCIIFHQDTTRPCVWWPGKNFYSLAGSSDSSAIFTRYCTFGIPFIWPLQILLMEENSIPWSTVKGTWNSSLLKKVSFGKMKLWNCWKKS